MQTCHFTWSVREFPNLLCREIIFMWQPWLLIVSWVNVQTPVAVSNVRNVMWIHKLKENVSSTFIFDEQKTQYCVLCMELKYVDPFSWQIGRATSVMPPAVRHSGLSEVLLCVIPNVVAVGAVHSFLEMSPGACISTVPTECSPFSEFTCLMQDLVCCGVVGGVYRTWFFQHS
jgi:hypothetical protein